MTETPIDQCRYISVSDTCRFYGHDGPGLPLIIVNSPLCQAVISQQGAQILEFQATGHNPMLWLSPKCQFKPNNAIRGGIPICFPWFGTHPSDPYKSKHGFVRQRLWKLDQVLEADDGHCQIALSYLSDTNDLGLFESAFTCQLVISLGLDLTLEISAKNLGLDPMQCSWAMHTYFAINDLTDAAVNGLDGQDYLDNTEALVSKRQIGDVRFNGEIDRVYPATTGPQTLLSGSRIRIDGESCPTVIVWNPGPESAAKMSDIGMAHFTEFVCIERGAAFDDTWTLQSNEHRYATMRLRHV